MINAKSNPKIHAGLELLAALGATELKTIEIRDLLYNPISKDFNVIDEILEIVQKEKRLQRAENVRTFMPPPTRCIRAIEIYVFLT